MCQIQKRAEVPKVNDYKFLKAVGHLGQRVQLNLIAESRQVDASCTELFSPEGSKGAADISARGHRIADGHAG